ncbi:MAG: SdpI family protein [Candidatus Coatesbacteria bacterium]|nr:SdpI family protein [Candidatus Coatesbacteria bacterium]
MTASHIGTINLILGLLVIGLSIPLLLRKIPRNWSYGIKLVPKAHKSDENWYEINAYGSKWLIGCGAILAVIGALTLSIDIQDRQLLRVFEHAWVLIVLALIPIIVYSRKL